MASNMDCVGLSVDDVDDLHELVLRVLPDATTYLRDDTYELVRWQDPSGVRLVFAFRDGKIDDYVPTFAASRSTRLEQLTRVDDDIAYAEVVDAEGVHLTGIAFTPEELRVLPVGDPLPPVSARIVFLGNRVTVHADADAFMASTASYLNPAADPDEPQPEEERGRGLVWPPRVAAESFLPYGTYSAIAEPTARFAGTVRHAERLTVAATGRRFIAAEVDTFGIRACVCLADHEFDTVPEPGQILAGHVHLVGSIDHLGLRHG